MPSDKHLRCSFCGKSKDAVKKFISGPNVYICNECIALCNEILAEEEEREGHRDDAVQEDSASRAAFVGRREVALHDGLVGRVGAELQRERAEKYRPGGDFGE